MFDANHIRVLAPLVLGILLAAATSATVWAQQPAAADRAESAAASSSGDEPDEDNGASVEEQKLRTRFERIRESTLRQIESAQDQVHIYQLVEEMTDELTADLSEQDIKVLSPLAFRKIGLSPNLSTQFGSFVEATVLSSIATQTDIQVKRCTACQTLRSRTEEGNWVVTLGLVDQKQLADEARRLGVKNFLNLHFAYFPAANIVAMQVEVMRASDGAIVWTESYRSDSTTAAILRSGDRVLTRAERVAELHRKIEQRPDFGYTAYFGASHIPYDIPSGGITGAAGGIRLHEHLGTRKRWRYGIGAEGFANFGLSGTPEQPATDALVGAFVGATAQYRLFPEDLNEATFWTGPTLSGFFAGSEGNSFAAEWGIDGIFQFRLGAGASVMYFVPVRFADRDLGGLGYKVRVSFNW